MFKKSKGNFNSNIEKVGSPSGNASKRLCYRCGDSRHLANTCNIKNSICNFCSVKGYIKKACLKFKKSNECHEVSDMDQRNQCGSNEDDILELYQVTSNTKSGP